MNLLKAVIGLIVFAILLGAFIALRSRNSAQQIGGPASPSPNATQVRSVGQTTQRSTNQPATSVPASQTGASGTGTSGTSTTTTTTTQPAGTSATGTAGSGAAGGTTTTTPNAAGAGNKPVPALW
jgi:cytoskeletal protein RodZ